MGSQARFNRKSESRSALWPMWSVPSARYHARGGRPRQGAWEMGFWIPYEAAKARAEERIRNVERERLALMALRSRRTVRRGEQAPQRGWAARLVRAAQMLLARLWGTV